jgi:hypothetical protein
VNVLREAFQRRLQYELDQKQRQADERQRRYQNDLDRRLHPRTKDDFDVLYAALESEYQLQRVEMIVALLVVEWREEEMAKINATKQGAGK